MRYLKFIKNLFVFFIIRAIYGEKVKLHDFDTGETFNHKMEWEISLSWWGSITDKTKGEEIERNWKYLQFDSELFKNKIIISTTFGKENYGHFLLDGLGKLSDKKVWLNQMADKFVFQKKYGINKTILNYLGISEDKVIYAKKRVGILVDCSFPSVPNRERRISLENEIFFRAIGRSLVEKYNHKKNIKKKIFIDRISPRRNLSNRIQIISLLESQGYYKVSKEEKDFLYDIVMAEEIIAIHGADVSDIVFAINLKKYIEIRPKNHSYDYFTSIAVAKGAEVTVIEGEPNGYGFPSEAFYVSIESIGKEIK